MAHHHRHAHHAPQTTWDDVVSNLLQLTEQRALTWRRDEWRCYEVEHAGMRVRLTWDIRWKLFLLEPEPVAGRGYQVPINSHRQQRTLRKLVREVRALCDGQPRPMTAAERRERELIERLAPSHELTA
jgi:hypothetical protein